VKICEYENVKCPYCQEGEKLSEMTKDSFEGKTPYVGVGPWHFIRCDSCSGEFAIPCQD